ncbi:MAG: cupredoxin domain-containing protein, partial [Acidimicrobiales bacterium]
PGTYEFFCEIHPQAMRGTLVVSGEPLRGTTTTTAGGDDEQANVPAGATAAVEIVDFEFSQTEVAVAPGGEITWQNTGQAPHTATFDDAPLDTGRIEPGTSARLTAPEQPGTYSYFCAIHPSMRGAVLVPAASQAEEGDEPGEEVTTTTSEAADEDEAAAQAADAGDGDDDGGLASVLAVGFGAVLVATGLTALALALRRAA